MVGVPQPKKTIKNRVITRSQRKKQLHNVSFIIEGQERKLRLLRKVRSLEATLGLESEFCNEHWRNYRNLHSETKKNYFKTVALQELLANLKSKLHEQKDSEIIQVFNNCKNCVSILEKNLKRSLNPNQLEAVTEDSKDEE